MTCSPLDLPTGGACARDRCASRRATSPGGRGRVYRGRETGPNKNAAGVVSGRHPEGVLTTEGSGPERRWSPLGARSFGVPQDDDSRVTARPTWRLPPEAAACAVAGRALAVGPLGGAAGPGAAVAGGLVTATAA